MTGGEDRISEWGIPLLLTIEGRVSTTAFIARVRAECQVLISGECGEWSWYGFFPGSIAAGGGQTVAQGQENFKQRFFEVVGDIADESASFDEFRDSVIAFMRDRNDGLLPEWSAAVEAVRLGDTKVAGFEKKTAPAMPPVEITELWAQEPCEGSVHDSRPNYFEEPVLAATG